MLSLTYFLNIVKSRDKNYGLYKAKIPVYFWYFGLDKGNIEIPYVRGSERSHSCNLPA